MKYLIPFISMLILSSCASLPKVSDSSLVKNAQTVRVNSEVGVTDKLFYQTLGDVWGAGIGGAVGGAAASDKSDQEIYAEFLILNGIDVGLLAYESFREVLGKSNFVGLVDDAADLTVDLEVHSYGIHPAGMMSAKVEPVFGMRAIAVDAKGEVAWVKQVYIHLPDDELVKPQSMGEYLDNPELLLESYKALSVEVSERLVNDLRKKKTGG